MMLLSNKKSFKNTSAFVDKKCGEGNKQNMLNIFYSNLVVSVVCAHVT